MSIVETLHAERKARLARFQQAAVAQKVQPKPTPYYVPNTPYAPKPLAPPAFQPEVDNFSYEAAWALAVEGLDDFSPVSVRKLRVEEIQALVAVVFNVARDDILSDRRHKEVARARQVAIYLTRHLTAKGLPEIGRLFGGRDHTTVLHSVRVTEVRIQQDPEFSDRVRYLYSRLKARQ